MGVLTPSILSVYISTANFHWKHVHVSLPTLPGFNNNSASPYMVALKNNMC